HFKPIHQFLIAFTTLEQLIVPGDLASEGGESLTNRLTILVCLDLQRREFSLDVLEIFLGAFEPETEHPILLEFLVGDFQLVVEQVTLALLLLEVGLREFQFNAQFMAFLFNFSAPLTIQPVQDKLANDEPDQNEDGDNLNPGWDLGNDLREDF